MTIFYKKGFTLIEIALVMVLISILISITIPLISNVVARNDVGAAHESLYNAILRAQQLSKNQYQDSQWRVCLDNTNKQYTITSGTCSDPTNAEIIKISSNITISSEQTLDILFKAISGELDNTSNSITINLTGGGASKSIKINPSGAIDKEANTTSVSTTTTPSIVTNGLVLNLDAGNINSYPGLSGTGNIWFDLSGNGNNGTLVNGVGYNSANGGSLVFDGVNDVVDGTITGSIFTGSFTQSAWVYKLNANQIWQGVFTNSSPATNNTYLMTFGNGSVDAPYNSVGVNQVGVSPAGVFLNIGTHINKWLYITIAKTGSTLYIYCYKDGSLLQTSGTITWNGGNFATTNNYQIGRHWAGGSIVPFQGNISQVSIYNRALTPQEIQQNFNATRGRFGL